LELSAQTYFPCLRWKQGEYKAIYKLSSKAQDLIVPIIEIPENSYDFEKRSYPKTLDDHLSPFAKRVKEKWGRRKCYIDFRYIDSIGLMSDGRHPTAFIFDDLRSKGVIGVPIVGLNPDSLFQKAIYNAILLDKRGLCFRVSIEEVAKNDFSDSIQKAIQTYGIRIDECDLIIDLRNPNFEPINGFANLLANIIGNLPNLEAWRTFILLGTSFPSSMGGIGTGLNTIPRNEWVLYKTLVNYLQRNKVRLPGFGDYTINHPEPLNVDMRLVKPNATIRYAIDDKWLIAKGKNVRDYHFSQFQDLSKMIVNSSYFYGKEFSAGDEYLYSCANNLATSGNLTTWRFVGTNHHLELVARDIANFFGS